MQPYTHKQLILRLITDDLINTRLVNSLNDLCLHADTYRLHASETILKLMQISTGSSLTSREWEQIHDNYIQLANEVMQIDLETSRDQLHLLSEKIYRFLDHAKDGA